MSNDYWQCGAVELAEGVRRRDYSSVDVVTSVLERIREKNPDLNAITVDCSEDALADAPVVANLRRAGAIIVGRTNTPEFSMRATTDNPLRGRTRNPWHADASPGGSSGGAGFGPIHHGNDIGGSLRFPSFACGVSTVKPTQGRVPAFNSAATGERGLLAGVVPAGRAAGLPAAVQIIGRRFREDLILDAMEAVEARLGVMAKSLW